MSSIRDLSDEDIAEIKARIARGEKYSEIASDYRLNQGRIADLKFGRIRPDIKPSGAPSTASSGPSSTGGQLPLL
jgi:hypothetical protein